MPDLQEESPRLANLRIASPCKERWADMIGDDRVRFCNGCERQVFDLSAMTRSEAEAVLATRGVTPCVRFYRRADGTVMTADCGQGERRKVRIAAVTAGTVLLGASPVMADPATLPSPGFVQLRAGEAGGQTIHIPVSGGAGYTMGLPPGTSSDAYGVAFQEDVGQEEVGIIIDTAPARRPVIEWSTWARVGVGLESQAPDLLARSTTPPPRTAERHTTLEAALGADVTFPIALRGDLRVGAWTEVRTSSGSVFGGELQLQAMPRMVVVRAGGNGDVVTGAIAFGDRGTRVVASVTRSVDDPRAWTASAGLELEPVGAVRYLLGK